MMTLESGTKNNNDNYNYRNNNRPKIEKICAFAVDPLCPSINKTNIGLREIYDCIRTYSLTVERVPLLKIEDSSKEEQQDDKDTITKLASASGISSNYIFPIYQATKRDGSTTNYRKDSANRFADRGGGNYVVVPRSFEQTTSYNVDKIDVEDLMYH